MSGITEVSNEEGYGKDWLQAIRLNWERGAGGCLAANLFINGKQNGSDD